VRNRLLAGHTDGIGSPVIERLRAVDPVIENPEPASLGD